MIPLSYFSHPVQAAPVLLCIGPASVQDSEGDWNARQWRDTNPSANCDVSHRKSAAQH